MNADRQTILHRIRESLRQPAPQLYAGHAHASGSATAATRPVGETLREWLPPVPLERPGQLELFAQISEKLQTRFRLFPNWAALRQVASDLIAASGSSLVACHTHPLVGRALEGHPLPQLDTLQPFTSAQLETAGIGFTACDALVAQTGSVLVSSRTCGGRALSVLPPHHVVIATSTQMVPDLTEAYAFVRSRYGEDWPSMLSLITGPSRTGDIERILVLGAHGPKQLTILCLDEG